MAPETAPPTLNPRIRGRNSAGRLFLNVRSAFPYASPDLKTSEWDWQSSEDARDAFSLLLESEKTKILRFYRRSDAALSLGSHLLKHLAIVLGCGVPWSESKVSQRRDKQNGKPYLEKGGLDFNVSHHGRIVALVYSSHPRVKVGIDVTAINFVKDSAALKREGGFREWLRLYEEMFSAQELQAMACHYEDDASSDCQEIMRKQLRLFYANWACKEAYIKMTSDALGAPYLRQLHFRFPSPPEVATNLHEDPWALGEVRHIGVSVYGMPVDNVRMELQALGEDYIIATAFSFLDEMPAIREVDLRQDILPLASSRQQSTSETSDALF